MDVTASRNRKNPNRWRSYALGAAAVAALLTTTACGPGSDEATGESRTSDRPSATGSTAPTSATPPAKPSATASKPPATGSGDGASRGDAGGGDGSEIPLCTMRDLSFSATNYDAKGEPVRHILLVAVNTGSKKCDIQGAPEVTLGNAKGPAPVKRETDPGEVLTLAPGQKAYAGLLATGGRMDTYDVRSLTLGLGSPGGESEPEKPVAVRMPVASFPADDGQRVTYWAGTEGLAMRPVTQS
ncbi:DUF4232 domain-containing protein [Streptomyces showdoensis]|uniref:DUF4232 domain-containing protein n=1 Tax=Streptomyces showdoensis TaxID=68268 RepID=UPI0013F4E1DF|nr:DUF4232 domain-containing protein [Streptomyces showdoensis]